MLAPLFSGRGGVAGSVIILSAIWMLTMYGAVFSKREAYAQKMIGQLNQTLAILRGSQEQRRPHLSRKPTTPPGGEGRNKGHSTTARG